MRIAFDPLAAPEAGPALIASSVLVAHAGGISRSLTVLDGYVYWGAVGVGGFPDLPGGIFRVSERGGTVERIAGASAPYPLASGEHVLYWFDVEAGSTDGAGALWRMTAPGGVPTAVATGQAEVRAIVADGAYLYWAAAGREGEPGVVARAAAAGGPVQVLARDLHNLEALALDAQSVYWLDRGRSQPYGLGSEIYEDGRVGRCPKGGGKVETLARGIHGPLMAIAVDASDVYFTTTGQAGAVSGHLYRLSKAGGHPQALGPSLDALEPLVLDSGSVYWSSEDDGGHGIWSLAKGGEPRRLTDDKARSMAFDDEHLYFIDGTGTIRAAPVPAR